MSLSTHVLDTVDGRPAAGMSVTHEFRDDRGWRLVGSDVTDDDGRIASVAAPGDLTAGVHRLTFASGDWETANGRECFWPEVTVTFEVTAPDEHHHVPLLLSPYGYSTYRGS
jgi:5-hydroxyisourate hydrolase